MLLLVAASLGPTRPTAARAAEPAWTERFPIEDCDFVPTGQNPYLILVPGHQIVLAGEEDGEAVELTITVLDETETVAGVETRVVEERAMTDGELTEIARNYYAYCVQNGGVFNFGEDTEYFEEGKVVGREGSWRAGEDDAAPGLLMPSIPLIGGRHYQELAPELAMDRAEIIGLDEVVETPAGTFAACLTVEESNPLEPADGVSSKTYAPGIGLVADADLLLVRGPDQPAEPPAATRLVAESRQG
jgi:hypothetical protein